MAHFPLVMQCSFRHQLLVQLRASTAHDEGDNVGGKTFSDNVNIYTMIALASYLMWLYLFQLVASCSLLWKLLMRWSSLDQCLVVVVHCASLLHDVVDNAYGRTFWGKANIDKMFPVALNLVYSKFL